jgi:hypothetical protein
MQAGRLGWAEAEEAESAAVRRRRRDVQRVLCDTEEGVGRFPLSPNQQPDRRLTLGPPRIFAPVSCRLDDLPIIVAGYVELTPDELAKTKMPMRVVYPDEDRDG